MAGRDDEKSAEGQVIIKNDPAEAEKILNQRIDAIVAKPVEPKPVASAFDMPMSYMVQMGCMMNLGNLYNSSPGRAPEEAATTALKAAQALCDEFTKIEAENADLFAPGKVYPMPIKYMCKMSAMMNNANLYNSSIGRQYHVMARAAMKGALALCRQYVKQEQK